MIIYLITNLVNQKQYIGLTIGKLNKRWTKHLSDARNNRKYYLHNAIEKHGSENFSIQKIDEAKNLKELKQKESFWIKKLNTRSPHGYNLTSGGECPFFSESTRKKLSVATSGKNNPMYGKKHSKDAIAKMKKPKHTAVSKAKLSKFHTGMKLTEEAKKKISKALKNRILTEKHKQNISEARKGYIVPIERRARISKTFKEKKISAGCNNPNAHLTLEQVREIRSLLENGETVKELMKIFPIKSSQFYNIKNNKMWKT